jgi:transcriptional regulator with XRE-family HTH domain
MIDLKAFRKANSITQVDLASFLGVGQGFISQIEKGDRPFPKENISKLLANPYGWDTSMLVEDIPDLVANAIPQLSNVEILLREMLAEKEAKIDALQDLIGELKAEIARLKTLLESERKGGDAQSADSSFVVDAI